MIPRRARSISGSALSRGVDRRRTMGPDPHVAPELRNNLAQKQLLERPVERRRRRVAAAHFPPSV